MPDTFEIYFHDLKEEVQQELLEFMVIEDPKDLNWDQIPLFVIDEESLGGEGTEEGETGL